MMSRNQKAYRVGRALRARRQEKTHEMPRTESAAHLSTGARYVDLTDPQFVGTLQVDFLWSIARHAR